MLENYERILDLWIGEILIQDNSDALFASGYLQGHFAVVLSQLDDSDQSANGHEALFEKMTQALLLAKKELESVDYALVVEAWEQLKARINGAEVAVSQ